MSNINNDSLYYVKNTKINNHNDNFERNTLLYPIAKSFFEQNNDYDDIINTFDY